MSDNRKIRRRQRCPECGSLDVIKWGVRTRTQSFKCGISSLSIVADLQSAGYYLQRRSQPRRSRPAGSIGLCGGSYCRRPGSVGGHFHQPLLSLSPTKNGNYALFGKTPSNATGNACDELRGGMDDAGKSSAPSIPWPGRTPRQASCYGRCFARSGPPMIPAVLQSTSTGDRLPTTFRDTFIAEVYAFPFHLAGRYALYGPATGFAREGGLQNWMLSDNPLRPSGLN